MEAFLKNWGYLGIFVGILLTGLGFPMPEELPVVLGGVLVADEKAYWWVMLPVCIVGVIIGDSFLYLIGRRWGPSLLEQPFIKKHLLTPERLVHIEQNFKDYGIRILLFARLTPGIRAPIFVTAGITRLPLARFLIADGIYAIPGVSILFYLGYWLRESLVSIIEEEAGKIKGIVILAGILGVAGYFVYRHFRRPVVTGDPKEMPRLVEQAVEVTSKIMHVPTPKHPGADPVPNPAPHDPPKSEQIGDARPSEDGQARPS